ncbi:hypothetical protein MMC27_005869 [Xylographa pallens]|nr:hypothetical protein [Xylographa pallens]
MVVHPERPGIIPEYIKRFVHLVSCPAGSHLGQLPPSLTVKSRPLALSCRRSEIAAVAVGLPPQVHPLLKIVNFSGLEKHEHSHEHCHDGEPFPPTSTHKALRLVDRALSRVATPYLFRYLSPVDFAFDADPEGESIIEQLCRSPCAIYVQELRMRPPFNRIKVDDAQILQSRIVRWTSIFTLMSVALSSLRILKLQSLHFESRSVFLNGSTCRTWADFLGPFLLRFPTLFPQVQQLQLYLSDQTGRDVLHHNHSDSPKDYPVINALANLPATVIVLESDPGEQSARFEKHVENGRFILGLVLPCCIGLHQTPHWMDMLPLVDFVELLAKDAMGLMMSTCGETVLPDCSLAAFTGLEGKMRVLQLENIALRASFVIDLLSRNRAALMMMVLQNVYLIDGTWEDVLRSTGGLDLMQPEFCFLERLRYASKGASSMWRDETGEGSKLWSKREADHKALEAFEDMLQKNADESLQSGTGPLLPCP